MMVYVVSCLGAILRYSSSLDWSEQNNSQLSALTILRDLVHSQKMLGIWSKRTESKNKRKGWRVETVPKAIILCLDFPNCGFFLKESHIGVVTRPLTVASVDAADVPQGRERDPKKRRV